ncbi:DUF3413 domain-containing protein [Coxiella endosymbiont of Amblyomma nuttalli]|uniref:DUF3413 domain-containing protein n=1 Tax=Coxiella endosymbiont of Amblyomma nuttalli TaxID=2749996 RepID=UPI001BAB6B2F|nr:DUF3413 domain-containing protein [Coxiella endosymbiont of Amblyomma nuttalli]QTS83626.1 Inner membrane protein YejM [Coxiella endosymbiont of Amblyomma nuttalli]
MSQWLASSRRVLCRWMGWFFLINVFLAFVIGIGYLRLLPDFHAINGITNSEIALAWLFLIVSFFTQLAVVFFFCCLLLIGIVVLFPRRWLSFPLAIIVASALIFMLVVDIVTFGLYHMHYFSEGLRIFEAGAVSQVIALSSLERLFLIVFIIVLFAVEYVIASFVWRQVIKENKGCRGYIFASVLVLAFLLSYGSMFITQTVNYRYRFNPIDRHVVLEDARILPYYDEVYSLFMPSDPNIRCILTSEGKVYFQTHQLNHLLKYPIHPLRCEAPKNLLNILIIGIDTWRYDAMNSTVSPNIDHFKKQTLQFQNHWSGGNCTQPGLVSLFYGIPPNYWRAFLNQHCGPVLIHQFLKNHYQTGIFISAPLNYPPFDKTIFNEVRHLIIRTTGDSSIVRDRAITKEFNHFIEKMDRKRPFFSFLFYDAVHNYCEQATPNYQPFQPAVRQCNRFALTSYSDPIPYVNRYYNAVYFVDHEVQKVLHLLKIHGLLRNTIVIITTDHGEQLNDERMGYWVHASAYTPYQLHIPLLMYWPGKKPEIYSYFTNHYDIVPTLMTQVLGCQNSLSDYTIGQSLFFKGGRRTFLVAGSYSDYAVITKKQVTRIYPDGDYVINFLNGRPKYDASLNKDLLQQTLEDLEKYFRY